MGKIIILSIIKTAVSLFLNLTLSTEMFLLIFEKVIVSIFFSSSSVE